MSFYEEIYNALNNEDITALKQKINMKLMRYDHYINMALECNNRPKNIIYLLELFLMSDCYLTPRGGTFNFYEIFDKVNRIYRLAFNYKMGSFLATYIKIFAPNYELKYSTEQIWDDGDNDAYNNMQKSIVKNMQTCTNKFSFIDINGQAIIRPINVSKYMISHGFVCDYFTQYNLMMV